MMKKVITTLFCLAFAHTSFALGPNEINFNGTKFYKSNEKSQKNVLVAEYEPANGSSSSIVLTHVLDKNDPSKIASSLKEKKSIEVMDVENLNPESSDVMVTFVKFDNASSKVENSLCRIYKNAGNNGSLVFQYIDRKNINKGDGAAIPDFTAVADNLKTLPLDKYITSMSETTTAYAPSSKRQYNNYNTSTSSSNNLPWYKRPGARTGASMQRDAEPARQYRYR